MYKKKKYSLLLVEQEVDSSGSAEAGADTDSRQAPGGVARSGNFLPHWEQNVASPSTGVAQYGQNIAVAVTQTESKSYRQKSVSEFNDANRSALG